MKGQPYYNLFDVMKRKGVTQQQLADDIGIDRSTLNLKINRSHGRDFTLEEAQKVSEVFNDSVENIFFGNKVAKTTT